MWCNIFIYCKWNISIQQSFAELVNYPVLAVKYSVKKGCDIRCCIDPGNHYSISMFFQSEIHFNPGSAKIKITGSINDFCFTCSSTNGYSWFNPVAVRHIMQCPVSAATVVFQVCTWSVITLPVADKAWFRTIQCQVHFFPNISYWPGYIPDTHFIKFTFKMIYCPVKGTKGW